MHRFLLFIFASLLAACGSAADFDQDVETDGEFDTFLADERADAFGVSESSPLAEGVLELVNTQSEAFLIAETGAPTRAVRSIIATRDGADGLPGTADDDLIESLAELDAVPWVGPVTYQRLEDYVSQQLNASVLPAGDFLLYTRFSVEAQSVWSKWYNGDRLNELARRTTGKYAVECFFKREGANDTRYACFPKFYGTRMPDPRSTVYVLPEPDHKRYALTGTVTDEGVLAPDRWDRSMSTNESKVRAHLYRTSTGSLRLNIESFSSRVYPGPDIYFRTGQDRWMRDYRDPVDTGVYLPPSNYEPGPDRFPGL